VHWIWQVGPTSGGIIGSPLWSYKHGLEAGYLPADPRDSVGVCARLTGRSHTFDGTYLPWQTGGAGAGTITAAELALYRPWPPGALVDVPVASLLPTYTSTGVVSTLPPPTLAPEATVTPPSGWANPADTGLAPTPIAGCTYPDPWDSEGAAVPPRCT
jgi:glucan 1,3-beta-glucosidase